MKQGKSKSNQYSGLTHHFQDHLPFSELTSATNKLLYNFMSTAQSSYFHFFPASCFFLMILCIVEMINHFKDFIAINHQ